MRKQQGVKLFSILFICTVFIYSFSHYGALAYNAISTDSELFADHTMIGSLDISGKSKQEALTSLTEELQKWRTATAIQLQYKEKSASVDLGMFHFELENTIENVQNGQKNTVIATVQQQDMQALLKQVSTELSLSDDDMTKLTNEMLSFALQLTSGQLFIDLEKLLAKSNIPVVISQSELKLDDVSVEIIDWIAALSPIKVEPKQSISLVKLLEERKLTTMPDSVKSMIAAGLYETVLPTNFSIIERHISQSLPSYVKLGYEANVNVKNNRDFVFANPSHSSYEIELQWKDSTLIVKLKGSKFLYEYKVTQSEVENFKPKTIIQYHPLLKSSVKVDQEGADGLLVMVYREVYGEAGEFLRKELISEDYYPPVHRIEIHKLQSKSSEETAESTDADEEQAEGTTNDGLEENSITPSEDDGELWGKPNETTK